MDGRGRTDRGRKTTGHDGTYGQKTDVDKTEDRTNGRTEDDDGDDRTDSTERALYIGVKIQKRHWDQCANVEVNRPREDVSGHAHTFPVG